MKNFKFFAFSILCAIAVASCTNDPQEIVETIDFESLTLNEDGYWNGADGSGSFVAGNVSFVNNYNADYFSWDGFCYSNLNDTETAGYGNQYSVFNSTNEGNIFAVFYQGMNDATASFPSGESFTLKSIKVCNATYTAKSIIDGDDYAKKFGGETGTDPDYLKVIFTGFNAEGTITADVEFFLADYRTEADIVIDTWTEVDLTGLGEINKITITLESTDEGDWGMNTPGYFCFDDIKYIVPEE